MYSEPEKEETSKADWLHVKLQGVHSDVKKHIVKALETYPDSWRDLLGVIPEHIKRDITIPILEQGFSRVNPSRPCGPAQVLLDELEFEEVTIENLILWSEKSHLEHVLMIIKPDVDLEIIEEPNDVVLDAGIPLQITCQARGFPTPFYQWLKNDEEIIDQVSNVLSIDEAKLDDTGVYRCKVYNYVRETGEERYPALFSRRCNVQVLEPLPRADLQLLDNQPKIQVHPRSPGQNLQHGAIVVLECKATGKPPLYYSWFRDDKELPGENNSYLHLGNVLPDLETGKSSWKYFCMVSNESGKVISNSTLVGLSTTEVIYTATDKVALLIGNENYHHMERFQLPSSDVASLAAKLEGMGFRVWAYVDLTRRQMYNAVKKFCAELGKGVYGVFYFAGHGFGKPGESYMQAVEARDEYIETESLSLDFVATEMQKYDPAICCLLLDMCRGRPTTPDQNYDREESRFASPIQKQIYKNIIFGYATAFLGEASEVVGQPNGLYVKYLKHHLAQEKSIDEVLKAVSKDMSSDVICRKTEQYSWISNGLQEYRSLCDPILNQRLQREAFNNEYRYVYSFPEPVQCRMGSFSFTVTFGPHKEAICNAIDMKIQFRRNSIGKDERVLLQTVFYPVTIKRDLKECTSKSRWFVLRDLQYVTEPMSCKLILQEGDREFQSTCLHLYTPQVAFLNRNTFDD